MGIMMNQPFSARVMRVLEPLFENPAASWSGRELERRSGVTAGALYPILLRLEAAGCLVSRWEIPGPSMLGAPRRRLYRLTAAGRREVIALHSSCTRGVFA